MGYFLNCIVIYVVRAGPEKTVRPHRIAPSHGGNTGSNPVGVTLGKENSPVQANRGILFIFINAQTGQEKALI